MKTPDADIKFDLNRQYTNHGLSITFVRRTARCLFDAAGTKYLINPYVRTAEGKSVEHVKPWGQYGGHFFAGDDK